MSDQTKNLFDEVKDQDSSENTNKVETKTSVLELLSDYKDPNGNPKYKDEEAVAKKVIEQDKFIDTLKSENAQLRQMQEEFEKQKKEIQEMRDAFERGEMKQAESKAPASIDPSQLDNLISQRVNQTLTESQQKQQLENNAKAVSDVLIKKFGDEKAKEYVVQRAKELDMTPQVLANMAATNPKAALKLLGVDDKKTVSNPAIPGVSNDLSIPQTPVKLGPSEGSPLLMGDVADQKREWEEAAKMVQAAHAEGIIMDDIAADKKRFEETFMRKNK